jgi:small subunit ribosomal protein S6
LAENVYESLFILDPNRYARDPSGVAGSLTAMVERVAGQVLASRLWNEQKLAYPINGHRKGTYWLTYCRMDSERLAEFHRACRLNENILRNLTLKVDGRLVDAFVAHAQGKTVRTQEPTTPQAVETARP